MKSHRRWPRSIWETWVKIKCVDTIWAWNEVTGSWLENLEVKLQCLDAIVFRRPLNAFT